jgi:hypothetical protein
MMTPRERHELHGLRLAQKTTTVNEVRQIEEIPILGTGKTDYKELRRLVTEAVAPHG